MVCHCQPDDPWPGRPSLRRERQLISMTAAPRRPSFSTRRWASAACSIGYTRSTMDLISPASTMVFSAASSSNASRAKAKRAVLSVRGRVPGPPRLRCEARQANRSLSSRSPSSESHDEVLSVGSMRPYHCFRIDPEAIRYDEVTLDLSGKARRGGGVLAPGRSALRDRSLSGTARVSPARSTGTPFRIRRMSPRRSPQRYRDVS